MPKIAVGVASTSFFNLDGLDYGKNQYQVVYNDVEVTAPATPDLTKVNVGLFSKYTQQYIQIPTLFSNWTNSSDTPYASVTALLTDLETLVGFESGGGGGEQYVRQFIALLPLTVTDRWRGYTRNSSNMLVESTNASYGTDTTPVFTQNDINRIYLKDVSQLTEMSFYHNNATTGGDMNLQVYVIAADYNGDNGQVVVDESWAITNGSVDSNHTFTIADHTTLDADSSLTIFVRILSTGTVTVNTLQSVQFYYKFE